MAILGKKSAIAMASVLFVSAGTYDAAAQVSADVNVGDIGVSVDVGGPGGISVGPSSGSSGINADVNANLGGPSGVNADVNAGVNGGRGVTADVDVNAGGSRGVGATANVNALGNAGTRANVNVGAAGLANARVNIGLGGRTGTTTTSSIPGTSGTTRNTTTAGALAGLNNTELMRMQRRCIDILGNPAGYDTALVQLCQAVRATR